MAAVYQQTTSDEPVGETVPDDENVTTDLPIEQVLKTRMLAF